jgi:hypothetical protein
MLPRRVRTLLDTALKIREIVGQLFKRETKRKNVLHFATRQVSHQAATPNCIDLWH